MTTTTTATLRLRDRIRLERYLLRLEWAMQDYPSKALRQIKRELRTEVTAAAHEVGMKRALADLGHPLVLAEGYIAQLGRRLPRWTSGIIAAGLAVGMLAYLFLAYSAGTLDTLDQLGGGTVTRYPFGAATTFTATADELSVETMWSLGGVAFVVAMAAVAFVLGARVWRLAIPAGS